MQAYYEKHRCWREYEWCLYTRYRVISLLKEWGDVVVIPTLQQAFEKTYSTARRSSSRSREWCHVLDSLAYVLGKFQTWDALKQFDLPPAYKHIAIVYAVFGGLGMPCLSRNQVEGLWKPPEAMGPRVQQFLQSLQQAAEQNPELQQAVEQSMQNPTAIQNWMEGSMQWWRPWSVDPKPVAHALEEQFGLCRQEQIEYITHFHQAYQEREVLHRKN